MSRIIKPVIRRIFSHSALKTTVKDQNKMKAIVKTIEEGERMQISFDFALKSGKLRAFNFNRSMTEEVGKTLTRMTENINKQVLKGLKKKKKKQAATESADIEEKLVSVQLFKKGIEVQSTEATGTAFTDDTTLIIDDIHYDVDVNTPAVSNLQLPQHIMPGFCVFPKVELEFSSLKECEFEWFIETSTSEASASASPESVWVSVQNTFGFTPLNEHIGKKVRVRCTPRNANKLGESFETVSESEVSSSPGFCPYMTRHEFTKSKPEQGFRIISYNLLADYYADSDFSREHLFPYCPHYALDIDYRQQLFTAEIIGYNADIICLQECDRKVFERHLSPILDMQGFGGVFNVKGTTAEGSAVYFNRNKFSVVSSHGIQLSEFIKESPLANDLHSKLSKNEVVLEQVINRSTSLQIVLLQCTNSQKYILIATTHLYWHPTADHIRVIQTAACLTYIQDQLNKFEKEGKDVAVIFSGDLNSNPVSANTNFLKDGSISADSSVWKCRGEEEFVPEMNLTHDFNWFSACGFPKYTNFTAGFRDCLDYIYVRENEFEVKQVIPLPSKEELELYTAIPSVVVPSDHLAIVCDLDFKTNL